MRVYIDTNMVHKSFVNVGIAVHLSRLLKIIGLFCKKSPIKDTIFCKPGIALHRSIGSYVRMYIRLRLSLFVHI